MSEWLDPRLLVVAACGGSAGIHAGLVPEHWNQSRGYGALFVAAAVGLAAAAAALALWPEALLPAFLAAGLFGSLIAAYVAAREPVDALAIAAKVIETVGLLLAVVVARRPPTRPGDLALAYFALTFTFALTLAASAGH